MDQLTALTTPPLSAPDGTKPAESERLRLLAAQFESLLLGQMLKEMRASMFDDSDEEGSGLGSGPLADTLFSEMSLALSRAGGIGLAQSVLGPLARQTEGDAGKEPALAAPAVLPGRVTSAYGWRRDPLDDALRFHKGLDIALPEGHDVPAARAGTVTFAGDLAGYGTTLVIQHADGLSTRYAHLSAVTVQVGAVVTEGQVVARSGSTGRAAGPHLHFEVLERGNPVNPADTWASSAAGRSQERN
jgi:murein DD-endopeptidase MepM/ murein hydrolase activator NlpD